MRAHRPSGPGIDPDIVRARGLPGEAYTSDHHLDLERRGVLARSWIGIAVEEDVAEPGGVHPVDAAGQPLLLVRDRDGVVRVFHNLCRHRGTRLVDAASNRHAIVCPYHGWTYSLDGRLHRTPHFEHFGSHGHGGLDLAEQGLLEVRSGVWGRIVFVNLDGNAKPLAQWTEALAHRWRHFDLDLVRQGHALAQTIDVNWKLITENFLESYHLPFVHRGLNAYSPLEDHDVVVEGDAFFGQRSARYTPDDSPSGQLPHFPELDDDEACAAEYLCLFPTVWLSCVADHYRITLLEPLTPTRTRIRWIFYFVGADALASTLTEARQALCDRVLGVFEEDIGILERLQRGRASPAFDGGCFSPHHERAVHRFQRLIAADYPP